MDERIPLGILGSWFRVVTTPITNTTPSHVPQLQSDPRRWAMIFSSDSVAELVAHNDQIPAAGAIVRVPKDSAPIMWYFTQVGVLLHGPWFTLMSPAGTGFITEVLFEPPAGLGGA